MTVLQFELVARELDRLDASLDHWQRWALEAAEQPELDAARDAVGRLRHLLDLPGSEREGGEE